MKRQGVCSNAFIQNPHGEFLLMKRSLNDDAYPGNWELPGGGIEYAETMEESLVREVQEECGLIINVFQPIAVNMFYIDDKQYFEITFFCKVKDNSFEIKISPEHSEYKWVKVEDIEFIGVNDYMLKTLKDCQKSLKL